MDAEAETTDRTTLQPISEPHNHCCPRLPLPTNAPSPRSAPLAAHPPPHTVIASSPHRLIASSARPQVWVSFASFEASAPGGGGMEDARSIFRKAYDALKEEEGGMKDEVSIRSVTWDPLRGIRYETRHHFHLSPTAHRPPPPTTPNVPPPIAHLPPPTSNAPNHSACCCWRRGVTSRSLSRATSRSWAR